MKHTFANIESACAFVGVVCPPNYSARLSSTAWLLVPIQGHHRGNTAGRIRLFPDHEGGVVFNWITGEKAIWVKHSNYKLSKAELKAKREAQQAAEARAIAEQMKRYHDTAELAKKLYNATDVNYFHHPYLVKKFINNYLMSNKRGWDLRLGYLPELNEILGYQFKHQGTPLMGHALVVPLRDYPCCDSIFKSIKSLQLIDGNGKKTMLAGGQIKGNAWYSRCFMSEKIMHEELDYGTIGICEGVATAISVTKIFGVYTVAAMSCTNLKPVALKIRKLFPNANIVIYGDKGNGERDAYMAAQSVNAYVQIPSFTNECLKNFMARTGSNNPTDFNDLMVGLGEDNTD